MLLIILFVHCSMLSCGVGRGVPDRGVPDLGVAPCILMPPGVVFASVAISVSVSISCFMTACGKEFCCGCVIGALSACSSTFGGGAGEDGAGGGAEGVDVGVGAASELC